MDLARSQYLLFLPRSVPHAMVHPWSISLDHFLVLDDSQTDVEEPEKWGHTTPLNCILYNISAVAQPE